MLVLISYAIHLLFSVVFFLLIPFVWLLKGSLLEGNTINVRKLLRFYKPVILIAHIGIITSVITGFYLASSWLNIWFAAVVFVWIAISAFLGMTAKYLRLVLEQLDANDNIKENKFVKKLSRSSLLLTATIILMFALKVLQYV
ncbi:hypothetical protein [Bacillus sp. JCM 19034]|uniref:hypothetical protein n=1 Tax=Bacillus sp. JCM 19034 TaxID=1481928 RepID=UPI0007861F96|nr:hypothetical protein [Bacillus sp. JCM 19034]